ncbi:MAG: response regulator transcription factor [Deefgea sp.]
MVVQHCVISSCREFQRQWSSLLGGLGAVLCCEDENEIAHLVSQPPLSCVLDMQSLTDRLTPNSLADLAKVTSLLLVFSQLTVEEELAWLATGVRACCTPDLSLERLAVIIDVTYRGGIWVSNAALPFLLKGLQQYTSTQLVKVPPLNLAQLTPQERKVADLVACGNSNKLIARELNISDRTVKTHLGAIYSKLHVPDRVHLALLLNQLH